MRNRKPAVNRDLAAPEDSKALLAYRGRAGDFYGDRFPSYVEFQEFLAANRGRKFDQNVYYDCAMAICAGGSVSEGYSSDIDLHAPQWFKDFQERTIRTGVWTGEALLTVLEAVKPQ